MKIIRFLLGFIVGMFALIELGVIIINVLGNVFGSKSFWGSLFGFDLARFLFCLLLLFLIDKYVGQGAAPRSNEKAAHRLGIFVNLALPLAILGVILVGILILFVFLQAFK